MLAAWKREKILFLIMLLQIAAVTVIYKYILGYNDGHFVYALDDPYIFLAMSKHHYLGVTPGIITNASSSLLGLYALTLFRSTFGVMFPFFLNLLVSLMNTILFWRCVRFEAVNDSFVLLAVRAVMTIILILATNQITLIFTGMEHNIQVLLCTIAFLGVITELKENRVPWWFVVTVILLPLWRYDCFALYIPLLLFLYARHHVKESIFCFCFASVVITLYFAWWHSMGQPFFPASLIVRSYEIKMINQMLMNNHVSTFFFIASVFCITGFISILLYAMRNFIVPRMTIILQSIILLLIFSAFIWSFPFSKLLHYPYLFLAFFIFTFYVFTAKVIPEWRLFAAIMVIQIYLELSAIGVVGGFRFSAFWNVFVILGFFWLFRNWFEQSALQSRSFVYLLLTTSIGLILQFNSDFLTYPQSLGLFYNVVASNSMYRQQYQMARFVKDYYQAPVAVNDVGLVSYSSPDEVYDVCGIANSSELENDISDQKTGWCYGSRVSDKQLRQKNINLLMIYIDSRFIASPPKSYQLIGVLHLLLPADGVASRDVYFFATPKTAQHTIRLLKVFEKTLPPGVKLQIAR